MKIAHIGVHLIRVPFDMGAAPTAFAGMNWTSVDSLFVRVLTDQGIEGWGEGWGHVACPTTLAALSSLVGPAFIGRDAHDRAGLMLEMQHRFHIHGRTGPVMYALSAVEIALWDIAGKLASQPIATLLGGAPRELDAYASLLRYSEPPLVAAAVERALAQGFRPSSCTRSGSMRCSLHARPRATRPGWRSRPIAPEAFHRPPNLPPPSKRLAGPGSSEPL